MSVISGCKFEILGLIWIKYAILYMQIGKCWNLSGTSRNTEIQIFGGGAQRVKFPEMAEKLSTMTTTTSIIIYAYLTKLSTF